MRTNSNKLNTDALKVSVVQPATPCSRCRQAALALKTAKQFQVYFRGDGWPAQPGGSGYRFTAYAWAALR